MARHTAVLEANRGAWNSWWSGGMRRYQEERRVKTMHWVCPDAEERKRGEQTGLDTLVVHALNDVY